MREEEGRKEGKRRGVMAHRKQVEERAKGNGREMGNGRIGRGGGET